MKPHRIDTDKLFKLMRAIGMGTGILAQEINEHPDVIQAMIQYQKAPAAIVAKVEAVLNGIVADNKLGQYLPDLSFAQLSRGVTRRLANTRSELQLQRMVSQGIVNAKTLREIELARADPRKSLIGKD